MVSETKQRLHVTVDYEAYKELMNMQEMNNDHRMVSRWINDYLNVRLGNASREKAKEIMNTIRLMYSL